MFEEKLARQRLLMSLLSTLWQEPIKRARKLTHDNLHLEVVPPHLAAQRAPALDKAVSLWSNKHDGVVHKQQGAA